MNRSNFYAGTLLGLLLAVIALALVVNSLFGRLTGDEEGQLLNRATNVEEWCSKGIDSIIDYQRAFTNESAGQLRFQGRAFERALGAHSPLSTEERAFLGLFVRSVVRLESSTPRVLAIHPYKLTDLDCETLVRKTLESPQGSGPLGDHPMVSRIERERHR